MTDTIETSTEAAPAVYETLENMISTSEGLAAAAHEAQLRYEDSLKLLATAHGSTYTDPRTGQIQQIRHREDSKQGRPITYLCALKAEPKTWLKGHKKQTTAQVVAAPEESIPETGGATVIE